MLAFCSVFLVVVSTLVINQIISKGSIIFLKIGESSHGEIDAFITPVAEVVKETLEKIEYDSPALLNYTAVNNYYMQNDPKVLQKMLLSPRKIFSGVKMLKESESKLYGKDSSVQRESWHQSFDKKTNLPHRGDAYHVDFPSGLDDNTIVAFKTERERSIAIGYDYLYEPMGTGECRVISSDDNSRGIKDGDIIFMRQGPFNLMPLVEAYEQRNKE